VLGPESRAERSQGLQAERRAAGGAAPVIRAEGWARASSVPGQRWFTSGALFTTETRRGTGSHMCLSVSVVKADREAHSVSCGDRSGCENVG